MTFKDPIVVADQISDGQFAGTYTVPGLFVVGDPAAERVEIGVHPHDGSPSQDERGVRLYDIDGSVLIDLNPDGQPTITGALIRTAATGARWELTSGSFADTLSGYSGDAFETTPARILVSTNGHDVALQLSSGERGTPGTATLSLISFNSATGDPPTASLNTSLTATDVTVAGSSVSRGKRSEAHLTANNGQNLTTAALTTITGNVSTDNAAGAAGNLAVTVPVVSGRVYMVLAALHLFSTIAGDNVQGAVVASTGTLNAYVPQLAIPANGRAIPAVVIGWYYAAATGNVTFTGQMARASGTGTVSAALGSSVAVIDVG